jgi:hypothetical protein
MNQQGPAANSDGEPDDSKRFLRYLNFCQQLVSAVGQYIGHDGLLDWGEIDSFFGPVSDRNQAEATARAAPLPDWS